MAKKKKKKAVKKKNVSNKKRKTNIAKKKNTASRTNKNVSDKSNSKKANNTSAKKIEKVNVKNNNTSKKVSTGVKVKNNTKKNVSVDKKANNKQSYDSKKNIIDNKNINSTKKKTQVNKKILVISFVLLVLATSAIIFLSNNINNRTTSDGFIKISFDEYLDLYNKEGLEFVYLYHSGCINCDKYEERLFNLEKEFEIKIKKFDYSKLNKNDLSILKSSNSFLEDGIEIPMIISIKDGNAVSSISGIKEYAALKNFVSLSKNEQGINNFNKIDVNKYLSLLSSKEKNVIYICDSSDSCNKFSLLLDSVSSNKKIKINYLNTENITSSDDWDKLESSSKIFDKMWFMPVIMIVKDDKIIDYKMETLNEKDLKSFFKKNGM